MAEPATFTPIPFRPAAPGEGYFDDDSLIRRVNRELIVAFSGARALLIQAAHPVMFEGFYDRSSGLQDPHGRLARTATIMNTIYFGRRSDADEMTARVRRVHSRINGALPEPAGRFPAGTPYAADDPQYLLWTLAPLFESADRIYRLYVGDLDRDERDALWQDYRVVGSLFGLLGDQMPATIEDFDAYYEGMLEGGDLWVTPRARELGRAVVFHPPAPRTDALARRDRQLRHRRLAAARHPARIRAVLGSAARGGAARRRAVHEARPASAAARGAAQHAGRRRPAVARPARPAARGAGRRAPRRVGSGAVTPVPEHRPRDGVRRVAPLALVVALFGVTFGVLARDSGFTSVASVVFSVTTFAGSAQFAAAGVLSAGGTAIAAIAAALLLNMRYLAIGMSVAPALHGRWWERFLRAQIVVDEAWAVSHLGAGRYDRRLLLGAGLTLYGALGARHRDRRRVRVADRRPRVAGARRRVPGPVPRAAAGADPREALGRRRAARRDDRPVPCPARSPGRADHRGERRLPARPARRRRPVAGGCGRRRTDRGDAMSASWVVVVVVGLGTMALKAAGPLAMGGRELPVRARSVVALLAPTLLAALIVVQTFADGRALVVDARAAGVAAAGASIALKAPVLVTVAVAAVVAGLVRALA